MLQDLTQLQSTTSLCSRSDLPLCLCYLLFISCSAFVPRHAVF
ncbi:hypothetical protein HMPREF1577_01412 [Gardnerella pickettii JCP8017A]|uniref:Uncharacterized protein n=1 Tax=Gardnerella pickettii JCP8017A TaxID=1261062 RepID=T2PIP1_9BIFI|nr:hypothetical protein HMPREF1577_01412 [Gardnerella pickettii JCP8017A]